MKSKKGDQLVLPESLKLIIAVLCLLLLVYLAWNLYTLTTTKSELAQARETLKQIVDKINVLKEDEDKYMVVSPKDWYLIQSGDKLCICDKEDYSEGNDACCLNGAMKKLEKEVIFDSYCTFRELNSCTSLNEVPFYLFVELKDGKIYLTNEYSKDANKLFSNLLDYKGDGTKSVLELCQDYVSGTNKDTDVITSKVKEYFKDKKVDAIFKVAEKNENNLPVNIELYFYQGKPTSFLTYYLSSRVADRTRVLINSKGKEYIIILEVGKMEEIETTVGG